jgi:hypothetical protein
MSSHLLSNVYANLQNAILLRVPIDRKHLNLNNLEGLPAWPFWKVTRLFNPKSVKHFDASSRKVISVWPVLIGIANDSSIEMAKFDIVILPYIFAVSVH